MTPSQAAIAFQEMIVPLGDHPTPEAAFQLLLDFYRDQRIEGPDLEADGDMLLYQWGTNDWDDEKAFELNLTRQFILPDGEDDLISQLSLTLKYPPSKATKALKQGDKWCGALGELGDFEAFIHQSASYRDFAATPCDSISLEYEEEV